MKARGTDWKTARRWNTEGERRRKKPQNNKNVLLEVQAQRATKIPFSLVRTSAKCYTEIKHRLKTKQPIYLQIVNKFFRSNKLCSKKDSDFPLRNCSDIFIFFFKCKIQINIKCMASNFVGKVTPCNCDSSAKIQLLHFLIISFQAAVFLTIYLTNYFIGFFKMALQQTILLQ